MYPSIEGAVTILSTNAFVFAFNLLGSNLRHSHIWLSYGVTIGLLAALALVSLKQSRAAKKRLEEVETKHG